MKDWPSDIDDFDWSKFGDCDAPTESKSIEEGSEVALFDRAELYRAILMDMEMQSVAMMAYLQQPDDGFFADIVVPTAAELAGERRIVLGGLDWNAPICENSFPVITLPGHLIDQRSLKAILRCEHPKGLAAYLLERQHDALFYLPVMERVTEPIQGLLRCLLDGHFAPAGDPMDRKSTTHIIMTASWQAVKEGKMANSLDAGVVGRLSGLVGLAPWSRTEERGGNS